MWWNPMIPGVILFGHPETAPVDRFNGKHQGAWKPREKQAQLCAKWVSCVDPNFDQRLPGVLVKLKQTGHGISKAEGWTGDCWPNIPSKGYTSPVMKSRQSQCRGWRTGHCAFGRRRESHQDPRHGSEGVVKIPIIHTLKQNDGYCQLKSLESQEHTIISYTITSVWIQVR